MSENQAEPSTAAMSAQQQRLSLTANPFSIYRQLQVGERGTLFLSGFELYNFLFGPLAGLPGYALRSLTLPYFLNRSFGRPMIGRSVTIRQPHRISLGRKVMIDDFSVLDVRSSDGAETREVGIELGDHVLIGRSTILVAKDSKISLGNACNVSSMCRIATENGLQIGESTLVAAYAYIGPGNHQEGNEESALIERPTEKTDGVRIGSHSWIGAKATILDGVTIGSHVIIGAHSLVRDDIPDGAVAVGTPARIVRYRDDTKL